MGLHCSDGTPVLPLATHVAVTLASRQEVLQLYPTYGPSKAALEALSAIMAKDLDGTGVTVNVLVPGGVTNTPMISDEARLIQPEVMAPPLVWLASDAAGNGTGQRFLAVHWDTRLSPEEAAEKTGAPVAWSSIATNSIIA